MDIQVEISDSQIQVQEIISQEEEEIEKKPDGFTLGWLLQHPEVRERMKDQENLRRDP